jgi:hypothetical protein
LQNFFEDEIEFAMKYGTSLLRRDLLKLAIELRNWNMLLDCYMATR